MAAKKTTRALWIAGVGIRALLANDGLREWFDKRIEVSTPRSSWRRVVEGVTLLNHGHSPYDGDAFHEGPLVLAFFRCLDHTPWLIPIVFVVIDLLVAVALRHLAVLCQRRLVDLNQYAKEGVDAILVKEDGSFPDVVALSYLLSPFTIITCTAQSTSVLNTLALVSGLLAAVRGRLMASVLAISLATYLDLYPVVLLAPAVLLIREATSSSLVATSLQVITVFLISASGLLGVSFLLTGSWDFITATYGFVLAVPDLTPNVGLFWYLFTEMFEHFRTFFLCVFQLHAVFYVLPMTLRLKEHPLFLAYLLCHVTAVFKSYPTIGDAALPMSLMMMWRHLFKYIHLRLVIGIMFIASLLLMPTFWHLWIVAGSGNANFFYSGTLAYNLAHVLLISGMVFAFLRREFDLRNGLHPTINGEPAKVFLK